MKRLALALCLLLPLPALADPPGAAAAPPDLGAPLSAAEFEAYATGKTLTYADSGQVWGQEEYLPGRQVVWAFTGEPCEYGTWTAETAADGRPMLCFTYEGNPDPNCWQFYHGPAGLVALFVGGGGNPLSEVAQTDKPMNCPGPKVGA